MIVAHEVDVLCCTPTYEMRLGELFASHVNDETAAYRLKKIIVAGEPGGSLTAVRQPGSFEEPRSLALSRHVPARRKNLRCSAGWDQ